MTVLLNAQKNKAMPELVQEELEDFSLYLIEKLLEVFPSELLPSEEVEIKNIVNDWRAR